MVILRPQFNPTVGSPQAVALQSRMANLANQVQQDDENPALQQQYGAYDPNQQQSEDPTTGDFLTQQLGKLANRTPAPHLNPAERVTYADPNNTSSDNFTSYYDNLGYINQIGQNMLQAEEAKAAYKKMQQLQSVANGGSSSSGGNYGSASGSVPSNPKANFKFAQDLSGQYGWNNANELGAWYALGMKESGWNNNAQNPTSTAYGIGQFLNSTWGSYGYSKTADPSTQVKAMAAYIKARYGSPSKALAFHLAHNWY